MLNGAKIQIRKSEVEIACLTNALREATKKEERNTKKRIIDYQQELSGSYTSMNSSDEGSSQRLHKKTSKKLKRDTKNYQLCAN